MNHVLNGPILRQMNINGDWSKNPDLSSGYYKNIIRYLCFNLFLYVLISTKYIFLPCQIAIHMVEGIFTAQSFLSCRLTLLLLGVEKKNGLVPSILTVFIFLRGKIVAWLKFCGFSYKMTVMKMYIKMSTYHFEKYRFVYYLAEGFFNFPKILVLQSLHTTS